MTAAELAERIRNGAFQKICAAHGAVALMRERSHRTEFLQEFATDALDAALEELDTLDKVLRADAKNSEGEYVHPY